MNMDEIKKMIGEAFAKERREQQKLILEEVKNETRQRNDK